MRLINAEDIPYTMLYKENWMKGTGEEAQGAWKSDIDKMPTVDAVPVKHGEWEWNTDNGLYYCSNCQTVSPREDQDGEYCDCPNYCPNCGAKMDGGKE